MSNERKDITTSRDNQPDHVKSDRLLPALLLGVPFISAMVVHFRFGASLEAIGFLALVFLVIGGVYYLFWKPGEKGPDQLAAVFIIGESLGVATLAMTIIKLLKNYP